MTVRNDYGCVDIFEEMDGVTGELYALIDYIEVFEDYRQQGYGRELLEKAIVEAKKINPTVKIIAHEYDADVIELNDLVKFYQSCGFEVSCFAGENVVLVM